MHLLKFVVGLILCLIINGRTHNCKVKFEFRKVCNRFLINLQCQPPRSTEQCKRIRTTTNDQRCPVYDCSDATEKQQPTSKQQLQLETKADVATTLVSLPTSKQQLQLETKADDATTVVSFKLSKEAVKPKNLDLTTQQTKDGIEKSREHTFLLKIPSAICQCKTVPLSTTATASTTTTTEETTSKQTTTKRKKNVSKKNTRKEKKTELQMSLKLKKTKVEKRKSKMSRSVTGVDCGDKECSLHHRYVDKCTIFLHTNDTNCKIPCLLDGCKTEIRHFITCPIWECNLYSTTSTTTTTTAMTTSTEFSSTIEPTPSSNIDIDIVMYSSLGINGLFILALITFLICKICKKVQQRNRELRIAAAAAAAHRERFPSLPPTDSRFFSLASNHSNESSNENIPLLNRDRGQCNFYSDTLTTRISLSSTPTTVMTPTGQANNLLGERCAEREEMLSRVTTFKPANLELNTPSGEIEKETQF